jgi:hypothetical protein
MGGRMGIDIILVAKVARIWEKYSKNIPPKKRYDVLSPKKIAATAFCFPCSNFGAYEKYSIDE